MSEKTKNILGWVFAGLLTALAVFSGIGKIMATPESEMGAMFIKNGLWDIRIIVAVIEIACALIFIYPRTSTIGAMLMAAYWGGAMATEMTHGQVPLPVILPIALLGLSTIFRNPELFTRLMGKKA